MKRALHPILCLLLPALLCGQAKHTPTLDELLSLKTIRSPKLSPDGRLVAYQLRETDWKDNAYVSQLWLTNVASGASFQLTRGKKSVGQAQWSPDGRWLAFIAERESTAIEPFEGSKTSAGPKISAAATTAEKKADPMEKKEGGGKDADSAQKPGQHQIWMISPAGGEAWQLTKSETDVEHFEWSLAVTPGRLRIEPYQLVPVLASTCAWPVRGSCSLTMSALARLLRPVSSSPNW